MSNHPRVLASLSAYSCEGGFDGRYQPATCFTPTIALGRHPGPGDGENLWQEYEAVLDLAGEAGLAGVCFEISWARLEPRRGQRDAAALERYVRALTHAKELGLHVSVAAIDAAWPAWLGLEAWLMPWVVPVALEHVAWVINSLPADTFSVYAAREQLTRGFLDDSAGPPWRRGAHLDAASAVKNLDMIEVQSRAISPLVVTSVGIDLDEMGEVTTYDVDEVHVKSLVRGAG
ncbi:MAG: hypothetical protein HKL85_03995, partial [Acidimicrobiaceae bacterium]|nr:hypothetical protein [Acidimicrobiaceae bacterium]